MEEILSKCVFSNFQDESNVNYIAVLPNIIEKNT